MGADRVAQTADRLRAVRSSLVATNAQETRFRLGLALAVAVHAALIIGITRSSPRQMGEVSGRPDGISVVLVDAADLSSKNTFREDRSEAAVAPAAQQPPTPPAAEALAAPTAPQPPAPPSKAAAPPSNQPAAPSAASPPARRPEPSTNWAIDKEALEQPAPPRQPAKPGEAASAAKPKPQPLQPQPQPPQQQPQLTMPSIPVAPGGRTAAVMRPPGATRSGENDEFGRGVIRALRQTMPSPAGQLGRVTVRLLLSDHGNLVEVQLIKGAGIPNLDQSVVFAVRQASFPIPPAGSTVVDRTFLVTYVYN
ncbi:MAG: TonB family protein [Hyphomonadaceae bacterium]|nr:TonB family protein [Hyphomonadaceae bacterium]